MDTSQLHNFMYNDHLIRKYFIGVFAADELPLGNLNLPCILISNTQISSQSGEHWVSIYVDINKKGYFFDSLGRSPDYYNHNLFCEFLDKHTISWEFNNTQLQSLESSACGHYCLVFGYYICRGYNFHKIIQLFTRHKKLNDLYVLQFVQEKKVFSRIKVEGKLQSVISKK